MSDKKYTWAEAHEALKDLDVRSMGNAVGIFTIVVGSCGRDFNKTRTFKARSLKAAVAKVRKVFP